MIDFQQIASLALFLALLLLGFLLVLIAFIPISFGVTINVLGRDRWIAVGLGALLFLCCFGLLSSGAFPKVASPGVMNSAMTTSRFDASGYAKSVSVSGDRADCIPIASSAQATPILNIRNTRTMEATPMAMIECPQARFQSGEAESILTFLEDGGNSGLNQGWAKVRYEVTGWVAKDRLNVFSPNSR
jgi:hypothetical protein